MKRIPESVKEVGRQFVDMAAGFLKIVLVAALGLVIGYCAYQANMDAYGDPTCMYAHCVKIIK